VYTLHCIGIIGKERIQQQHQDHHAFFWERAEETVMMKETTPKTLAGL
jgi:hypothetical protein